MRNFGAGLVLEGDVFPLLLHHQRALGDLRQIALLGFQEGGGRPVLVGCGGSGPEPVPVASLGPGSGGQVRIGGADGGGPAMRADGGGDLLEGGAGVAVEEGDIDALGIGLVPARTGECRRDDAAALLGAGLVPSSAGW